MVAKHVVDCVRLGEDLIHEKATLVLIRAEDYFVNDVACKLVSGQIDKVAGDLLDDGSAVRLGAAFQPVGQGISKIAGYMAAKSVCDLQMLADIVGILVLHLNKGFAS